MKNTFHPGSVLAGAALATLFLLASGATRQDVKDSSAVVEKSEALALHYLEIVTPDIDAACSVLEKLHGVSFGAPEAALGNARTAELAGGGLMGVRAPMRETEMPVVRPYVRVDDIDAAIAAAQAAGGELAFPPTELPGHGTFAIFIHGGIEHGLGQP